MSHTHKGFTIYKSGKCWAAYDEIGVLATRELTLADCIDFIDSVDYDPELGI